MLLKIDLKLKIKNLKLLLTILIITILLALPAPTMAQDAGESSPSVFDALGSGISQLLTLNNPVRLDNPPSQFSLDQSPVFILITPQETILEEVTATITRKKGNKTLVVSIKMIEPGKFEISLENPVKVTGEYSLDVSAKESFFYTRQILHDFSWGSDKPKEKHRSSGFMKQFIEDRPEYKDKPVFKRDRNSIHFQKSDGTFEAQISSGPINYQDDKGQWQPIDTTLIQVGDDLVGKGTPAKIKTDGTVEVKEANHSQKTTKFGWFDSTTQEFTPVQDLPAGQIKEDQFIRSGDFFEHVLTLTDSGLKEELTLTDLPPNPPGNPNSYLMLETEVTGLNLPDGWIEEDIKKGGFNFPLPATKDASGKEVTTKRFAKKVNGVQYIYTGITLTDLKTSAFPLVIDPDLTKEGDTADGRVFGQTTAGYATARSTSNGFTNTDATTRIGQLRIGTTFEVDRAYFKFDTSSIPNSATVTQANLKLVVTTNGSDVDFDGQIIEFSWASQDPLSSGNMEAAYDNCLAQSASILWRNTSGISINTQYSSANLTTGYVNLTGSTYYSLRSSRDYSNIAPADGLYEYINIAAADHTTSGYRPVLTVTYTIPDIGLQVSGMRMSGIQIK